MGIREAINRKPYLTSVIVVLAISAAIYLLLQLNGNDASLGLQFYTDDDGKTFFSDAGGLPVPFESRGKTVVMAEVYEVPGKVKPYVAYMRRYTKASLERLKKTAGDAVPDKGSPGAGMNLRMEYKKPGDAQWHDIEGNLPAMAAYLVLSSTQGDLVQVSP